MIVHNDQHQEFIHIDSIEATLASEKAKLIEEVENLVGTPPLTTNILTLVIVTSNTRDAQLAHELVHQLGPAAPSRSIMIQVDAETTSPCARVWAHCDLEKSTTVRSHDVIEVFLGAEHSNAAPNIISRHKLPSVPVVVYWWGAVDLTADTFSRISSIADRIVIDSSCHDQPLQAILDFKAFLMSPSYRGTGNDLCWRRLTIWRQLIAQSFDPESSDQLFSAIRCAELSSDSTFRSESFLLASWLAASLKWKPESVEFIEHATRLIAVTPEGEQCTITLAEALKPGAGLSSLRIAARPANDTYDVTIQHDTSQRSTIAIESTWSKNLVRTVQHPEPTILELISEELHMTEHDTVYENSLTEAAEFAELLLKQENANRA